MNNGDHYTDLILRHKKLIWNLCRRYARLDADRCRDLVQEVSVGLWEYYGRSKPPSGLVHEMRWVVRNTNTLLRNMHRARQPEMVYVERWMAESIAAEGDDPRDLVHDLMDALSEDDRQILQMRFDGYIAEEIGDKLGLSREAVYQRINRIIKKLKKISNE